jgi:hypothetical protein
MNLPNFHKADGAPPLTGPNFHKLEVPPLAAAEPARILDASQPPQLPEPDISPIVNYLDAVDRASLPQSDPLPLRP